MEIEKIANRVTYSAEGKCETCPFWDDSLGWCMWYKKRAEVEYPECELKEIKIEFRRK